MFILEAIIFLASLLLSAYYIAVSIIYIDPSDVDLRHALANMIAVVFGLSDHSTHLWYHMFSPGDLENSYLTGFMV